MGEIVYRLDVRWDKPAVTLPGSEKWSLIDRHIIQNGFVADLCGQQMLFLDTENYWISLVSKTAALRISQIIGNDNVSVNYVMSYEPYYSKLLKAALANSMTSMPMTVCIGTDRLMIELDKEKKTITFDVMPPMDMTKKSRHPDFIYGLCYQPASHIHIPRQFSFPGMGRIIDFISPLFPDARSMITYMWFIGNIIRDPVAKPRCMMLVGPGGSGKSTALRMATAALAGCTNLIPDNILTRVFDGIDDKVAQVMVKSRLVTCYELDLDNKMVNMSMFKNITGSDYVKVGEFMARSTCSLAIATNGLPNVETQPEFTSDAISRRMVCIKMDVDTAEAPFEPDPSDPVAKMDFLCSCLYIRMKYRDIPMSPDNLLVTLCGSLYFKSLELVEEDVEGSANVLQCMEVIALLSGLLQCDTRRIVDRCRLISMSCIELTPMGYVIRGLRPKPRSWNLS